MSKKRLLRPSILNLVVVSDTHIGCQGGLCPPEGLILDGGGHYEPSALQSKTWALWEHFWEEWVPNATRGEPYAVCMNGDAMDGVHHGATSQISHNLTDQKRWAYQILNPVVEKCEGRYFHVRGTEAHGGQSGAEEESLARMLGAIPNEIGMFSRWDLWVKVGDALVHCLHHIGVTGSMAYETTALCKEYAESCAEAARWGRPVPNVVVRSHRHRQSEIRIPTAQGYGTCCVTPGWQLKVPGFVWKIAGARLSTPTFGGTLIRFGDEEFYTRHFVREIAPPKPEEIYVEN